MYVYIFLKHIRERCCYVPGKELGVVLCKMMKAQTTEREKTETHVFSVYISIASVKDNLVLFSAQFLSLSASAAYNARPCEHITSLR